MTNDELHDRACRKLAREIVKVWGDSDVTISRCLAGPPGPRYTARVGRYGDHCTETSGVTELGTLGDLLATVREQCGVKDE